VLNRKVFGSVFLERQKLKRHAKALTEINEFISVMVAD